MVILQDLVCSRNKRGIMTLERSPEFLDLEAPLLCIVESFEQYKEDGVS